MRKKSVKKRRIKAEKEVVILNYSAVLSSVLMLFIVNQVPDVVLALYVWWGLLFYTNAYVLVRVVEGILTNVSLNHNVICLLIILLLDFYSFYFKNGEWVLIYTFGLLIAFGTIGAVNGLLNK